MMRPCKQCFENLWAFQLLPDNWIRATCQFCAFEVEWEGKKRRALTPADNPDNKKPDFIWETKDGKQYRDGIEMKIRTNAKGHVWLAPVL